MPVCATRSLVWSPSRKVSVSDLPPRILPCASTAMNDSSTLLFGVRLSVAAEHLDAEQHRRVGRGALERRGEHAHRQPADGQRALQRVAHLRRRRARCVGRRRRRLAPGRRVPLARAHGHPGPRHAHLDLVELAVALVGRRRIVREHVVRAVVLDDAIEGGGEIVPVDRREPAGLLRQRAQAVLRQAQLVAHGDLRPMPSVGSSGYAADLDVLVAEVRQAARIDAVDG